MNSLIVFLPGMMCDDRLYSYQIEQFSANHNIWIPSYAGASSIDQIAKKVLQDAATEFVAIGLSMGGIVAMELLRQVPNQVKGVVLLDTNHLAETSDKQVARDHQVASLSILGLERLVREQLIPNYFKSPTGNEDLIELCVDMALSLGEQAFLDQSMALTSRRDQSEVLAQYCGPALIGCGSDDHLCPVSRHEEMHRIMIGSQFRLIDGAAHLPTIEQPEYTTSIICEWLDGVMSY